MSLKENSPPSNKRAPESRDDAIPDFGERFKVLDIIGRGAGGAVYKVHDHSRDEIVALKLMALGDVFGSRTMDRFLLEQNILENIDNPGVIKAYEVLQFDHRIGYTMEYFEGKDLSRVISRRKLDEDEVESIFNQLLDIVAALHMKGIFHRDLKLENILYSSQGIVKLTDFGLVRQSGGQSLTPNGILLGTAQYFPPEYIRKGLFNSRSEVYTLGLIFHELLVRKRWLQGMEAREAVKFVISQDFNPEKLVSQEINPRFRSVIIRAINPDFKERFDGPLEMKRFLGGVETFEDEGDIDSGDLLIEDDDDEVVPSAMGKIILMMATDPLCVSLEILLTLLLIALIAFSNS